ncbi:hypothetical protein LEP1GSC151_2386 [Leptospira interrogans serovar Grippotyphosa str. LT2186]|uniref:Uncharacterized protein n=1 Tax=Leptospira interrogans serovar Grippotyphosa str. LT2186 TaxID=1001599 RepID=M3FTE4_LEPIR|nr:hypothetical protein LEP1GSC097_2242 [Leptospira interrogans serovar Grippotyphosa str. UI 08368]EMG10684.1 hypothetical protein LEP1GSC151_2386 [Leptospira interrogans serovar Grippotyphosa str. LT2186]
MRRIKNAHFSSVPTRMSLFYLQKVCFSDREKFSEPYHPPPKNKENSTQRSHRSRSKLKLRTKYHIMFLSCNLLTGSERVVWFA